tara:strand:- start:418 stop:957 length:540 start_codon:yes stop_codon:yes gene_type:complete
MKSRIPDYLATFRVIVGPVVMYLIIIDGSKNGTMLFPALLAFIGAWTDYFDGMLARKWNVTSKLGAFLDTIADKLFLTSILLGLMVVGRVGVWVTFLLIAREFVITGLRGLAGTEGVSIPPSIGGKLKASLQFWALGFLLVDFSFGIAGYSIAEIILYLSLIVSYITGYQYIKTYFNNG